jgi:2-dehydro-3-deoxyphosphogalactonate aldolase
MMTFDEAFAQCPLVAIMRGVRPDEVEAIGAALIGAGFTLIEVPLNSPDPFESISRLAGRFGGQAMIGAGTVLDVAAVERLADAGGRMVVSPNTNEAVIRASVAAGMASLPGYFTPSEAFAALAAGASALKLFPAEGASPAVLKAQRAVLPKHVPVLAVGGISPTNMAPWLAAGAAGFGLGSALYKPGASAEQVGIAARDFIANWRAAMAGQPA